MNVAFATPWWLLGLLVLPGAWWLGLGLQRTLGRRRARWVAGLRTLALGLVLLALAGPSLVTGGRGVDVTFVVDASDSMGGVQDQARQWIADAQVERGTGDRSAVARFGLDAQVEHALTEEPPPPAFNTVVAGGGTDIARGLRLGQGLLGTQQHRRLVLVSDGRATQGDAERTAAEVATAGITVDVVRLGGATAADVLVEAVAAPGRVNQGEAYEVAATLRNTGASAVAATVITRRNGAEVDRADLELAPGQTVHTVDAVADTTGAARWEVEVVDPFDTVDANDVGRAGVLVDGPPSVLVVTGSDGAETQLVGALDAATLPTTVVPATNLPASDQLLAHDAVVLVDVPATAFDEADMRALDAFVRDAGRGLVIIGGDQTLGAGGWQDTPLEDLSPVFAEVQDPQTRPRVAEALVVDVSGSMAACHCREDQFGGVPGGNAGGEGGINKTDITKEAVSRAIDALSTQDTVGVLAFNDSAEWVLPLQQAPAAAVVDEALATLHPDGATNVVAALDQAIDGLLDVNAQLRHIVVFTDGFSEDPRMLSVAERALDEGITLSVVGTGEIPANPRNGNILERMAEAGGGRYYPGRDLNSIPDILVAEVQQVARPFIQEGEVQPVRTGADPVADRLEAVPSLLGYLATTAKPTAATSLRVGDFNDPLLARWQVGLGTSVAWTSDAQSVWATPWVAWDGYGPFFADLVASTFPRSDGSGLVASAVAATDGLQVEVTSDQVLADSAVATATVVTPDGVRSQVQLQRTGTTSWEVALPSSVEGVSTITVTMAVGGEPVGQASTTAIRSYSAEYLPSDDDAGMLAAIAAAGGGTVDPDPATIFDAAGLAPGSAATSLWPLLALLALVTVPVDVAVRRLRLRRSDFRRRRGAPAGDESTLATTLAASVQSDHRAEDEDPDGEVDRGARARRRAAWDGPPTPTGPPTEPSVLPTAPPLPPDQAPSSPPTPPAPPPSSPTSTPPPPGRESPPTDSPPPDDAGGSAARRLLDRRNRD